MARNAAELGTSRSHSLTSGKPDQIHTPKGICPSMTSTAAIIISEDSAERILKAR